MAELRTAAMRPSLEQLGRFDPVRARERLLNSFFPEYSKHIILEDKKVGFYTLRPTPGGLRLDHFYIHPDFQGHGIGARVLAEIFREADAAALPIVLGALKQSTSNRFYQRHGFIQTDEGEWDIYYRRAPSPRP